MSVDLGEYRAPREAGSGFWKTVGIPARGARLHEALREGVSYVVYKQLVSVAGLEHQELARYLVIPPATLRRRAKAGKFKVEVGKIHVSGISCLYIFCYQIITR